MNRVTTRMCWVLVCTLGMTVIAPRAQGAPQGESVAKARTGPGGERTRGLLVSLGFGAAACTDRLCDWEDVAPLVNVRLQALVRLLKPLGIGVHLSAQFFYPRDEPVGVDVVLWEVMVGPEVRGFFSWKRADFWAAFTVGYFRHQVSSRSDVAEYDLWVHGVGFGFGVGAAYYLTRRFALGLDFWIYKGYFPQTCDDDGAGTDCSPVDDQDPYGVTLTLGASATLFFGR